MNVLQNNSPPNRSFLLIDAGCKFAMSLIQSKVSSKDITIWEPVERYYAFAEKLQRIYGFNLVKDVPVIQFDVTISNPPFSFKPPNSPWACFIIGAIP